VLTRALSALPTASPLTMTLVMSSTNAPSTRFRSGATSRFRARSCLLSPLTRACKDRASDWVKMSAPPPEDDFWCSGRACPFGEPPLGDALPRDWARAASVPLVKTSSAGGTFTVTEAGTNTGFGFGGEE
jgi:hypothetical protein